MQPMAVSTVVHSCPHQYYQKGDTNLFKAEGEAVIASSRKIDTDCSYLIMARFKIYTLYNTTVLLPLSKLGRLACTWIGLVVYIWAARSDFPAVSKDLCMHLYRLSSGGKVIVGAVIKITTKTTNLALGNSLHQLLFHNIVFNRKKK